MHTSSENCKNEEWNAMIRLIIYFHIVFKAKIMNLLIYNYKIKVYQKCKLLNRISGSIATTVDFSTSNVTLI